MLWHSINRVMVIILQTILLLTISIGDFLFVRHNWHLVFWRIFFLKTDSTLPLRVVTPFFFACQCYSSHDFFVSLAESRGFLYNVFCAGGIDKENPLNPKDNRENGIMVFFRDKLGPILNNGWTKFLVMLIFLGYLGISSWGVSQLREGLERRKLSRYDSYSVEYYDTDDMYFREYPYRVNVSFSSC